ncbi:MspA family porin [Mycolicibacterium fortuitum]|uniref:MspA family porin n=1 Tax=Mycolicibacterium fortuitum TaxID=1766 RepID=UPI00149006AE|nr:MspA family porin [Mycolicibacterium fortuitum]
MLKTFVALAAIYSLGATAPFAAANPAEGQPVPVAPTAEGAEAPSGDDGAVASAAPGTLTTPEGWILSVAAADETQLSIAPLTTALSSREYLVGGSFIGTVKGAGKTTLTGGVLEAGYQIGCGINAAEVDARFGGSLTPSGSLSGSPSLGGNAFAQIRPTLKPGTTNIIPVTKMAYEGDSARVTITALRIKIDSCVGQSFIRSYATFTSSTADTQDVVSYVGLTKAV